MSAYACEREESKRERERVCVCVCVCVRVCKREERACAHTHVRVCKRQERACAYQREKKQSQVKESGEQLARSSKHHYLKTRDMNHKDLFEKEVGLLQTEIVRHKPK